MPRGCLTVTEQGSDYRNGEFECIELLFAFLDRLYLLWPNLSSIWELQGASQIS